MKKLTLSVLLGFLVSGSVFAQNAPWTAAQKEEWRVCNVGLGAEIRSMEKLYLSNSDKLTAQRANYFSTKQDLISKQSAMDPAKDDFKKTMDLCKEYTGSAKKMSAEMNSIVVPINQEADKRYVTGCIEEFQKLRIISTKLAFEAKDKGVYADTPQFKALEGGLV